MDRKPTSPWQRYNKKKWLYSPTYQLWKEEAKEHGAGSDKALALTCQHAKAMQVRRNNPDGSRSEECN